METIPEKDELMQWDVHSLRLLIADLKDIVKEQADRIKELEGPFTCSHEAQFVGGACAACHALALDALEKFKTSAIEMEMALLDVLGEHRGCMPKSPSYHQAHLVLSRFKRPGGICPVCKGGGEIGLVDGEVPCYICGGSGDPSRRGVFLKPLKKCMKCGKEDASVTKAVFLKDPKWSHLCHNCDIVPEDGIHLDCSIHSFPLDPESDPV